MRAAILLLAPLVFAAACGGSGGGTPSGPFEVNLTSAGVSPSTFTALSEASLRFTNHDTTPHQIASSNCGELATAAIAAGADATVKLGPGPKPCDFNDSLHPTAAAFQGHITVLAPGNGY
jgi:hypothetical protein